MLDAGWTSETHFSDGDEYFSNVVQSINDAKVSVDFEVYIFENDETGKEIQSALLAAANRGVEVRLMVDGFGSFKSISMHGGVKPYRFKVFGLIRFFYLSTWLFSSTLNRRDHRKLVVIDNHVAYVGSFNVTSVHRPSIAGASAWRDSGLRLEGEDVGLLSESFDRLFNVSFLRRRRLLRKSNWVRMNIHRRRRREGIQRLIQEVNSAQNRIWITTPYFAPSHVLFNAILQAARRGVDVRILVPKDSDVPLMNWISLSFYQKLEKSSCRVFIYQPSFIHAKILMVDDTVILGTSNFNTRSLFKDYEIDIVISKSDTKLEIERQYLIDLKKSKELDLLNLHKFRWAPFLGRALAYLFRNWI